MSSDLPVGRVLLVGAGPGDPDLLTLRAARAIGRADVIFVDALVDPRVLGLARPEAEIHDVGKRAGAAGSTPQEHICTLLLEAALQGKLVVRLKGGDPFLFGRGGEEALFLRGRGIPVEVVPGLSSSLAVPALAGIPVTHRGLAQSVTVLTGTAADPAARAALEQSWAHATRVGGTLVFLMGVHALERIVSVVLEAGRAATTPVAIIEDGASDDARVTAAELATIVEVARAREVRTPAVIVIGDVVAIRSALVPTLVPAHAPTVSHAQSRKGEPHVSL